jgi:hypothetical protein
MPERDLLLEKKKRHLLEHLLDNFMADIFGIEPPRWLSQRTSHGFDLANEAGELAGTALGSGVKSATTGENFFTVFKDAVNTARDPFYMEKAEAMRANAELTHATTADKLQGMKEYPEWLKETGGDWQKALDIPFTGTSVSGAQMVEKQKNAAWMTYTKNQAIELKKQDADNKLEIERQRIQDTKDKLEETTRHDKEMEDLNKTKSQYFKSGSDIYKVNPDTQELEKVVTGKDSKVSADDSLELLNKRTMIQSKLDSLTKGGGFGIHWNKTLTPQDKQTVTIYQKQLDDINKQLGMGSDESGTQDDSRTPVTNRFKILEVK